MPIRKPARALVTGDVVLHRDTMLMRDIPHVVTALRPHPKRATLLLVTVAPHGVMRDCVTWLLESDELMKVERTDDDA